MKNQFKLMFELLNVDAFNKYSGDKENIEEKRETEDNEAEQVLIHYQPETRGYPFYAHDFTHEF